MDNGFKTHKLQSNTRKKLKTNIGIKLNLVQRKVLSKQDFADKFCVFPNKMVVQITQNKRI